MPVRKFAYPIADTAAVLVISSIIDHVMPWDLPRIVIIILGPLLTGYMRKEIICIQIAPLYVIPVLEVLHM